MRVPGGVTIHFHPTGGSSFNGQSSMDGGTVSIGGVSFSYSGNPPNNDIYKWQEPGPPPGDWIVYLFDGAEDEGTWRRYRVLKNSSGPEGWQLEASGTWD